MTENDSIPSGFQVLLEKDWHTHAGLRELTQKSDFDGVAALCYFGDDPEVIESLSGVMIEFLMGKSGEWERADKAPATTIFPAVDYASPRSGWYLPYLEPHSQTRALVPTR